MACVLAIAGCVGEPADEAGTSESFVGSGGSVVGGKAGVRSVPSRMSHDVIALGDGSAATPVDQKYVERFGYVHLGLEFVSAKGAAPVHVDAPVPIYDLVAGPGDSALVVGRVAEENVLYQMRASAPPRLLAQGKLAGVTTATDGSIVWIEDGAKLHRLRGTADEVVPIAHDPFERTLSNCRTLVLADAEHYYDVCFSGSLTDPRDDVARVRTFGPDGSLEAEAPLPKEPIGGMITGFDAAGRLLLVDTGYTGDGDPNIGIHAFRYDPKTRTTDVISIPVFTKTRRWRAVGIVPTPDTGFALVGAANENFAIVKLRGDGTLDPAFDKDGAMSFDVPDWGVLAAGRASEDGERLELLGFGQGRTYALDVWLR